MLESRSRGRPSAEPATTRTRDGDGLGALETAVDVLRHEVGRGSAHHGMTRPLFLVHDAAGDGARGVLRDGLAAAGAVPRCVLIPDGATWVAGKVGSADVGVWERTHLEATRGARESRGVLDRARPRLAERHLRRRQPGPARRPTVLHGGEAVRFAGQVGEKELERLHGQRARNGLDTQIVWFAR